MEMPLVPPYPPYEQGLRPIPAQPEPEQPRRKDVPIEPKERATEPVQIVHERVIERPVPGPERVIYIHPQAPATPVVPGPKPPIWDVREPEVPKRESEVETKPEVPSSEWKLNPPQSEEKASIRKNNPPKAEEKASTSGKNRKLRYNGRGGRIHTEAQIDELLDFYLMTGELPNYVSDRQRYDYRHHERLPERKELLEQRGIPIVVDLSSSTGHFKNVIPITGTKVQRKNSTSR